MDSRIELPRLPVIDLSLFDLGDPWRDQVAALVDAASSRYGFFQVVGHGIDTAVVDPLMEASRRFFASDAAVRSQRRAEGDSTTSSTAVLSQVLLPEVPGFAEPVLDYTRALTGLAHKLMAMIARGHFLPDSYFVDRLTGNPSTSFRIYNHARVADAALALNDCGGGDSAAESGLLTIMRQDRLGGLELKHQNRWLEVPDVPNAFICTVGTTLAQLTNGRYLAAAYRVRRSSAAQRLSMPFCFDVSSDAVLEPLVAPGSAAWPVLANDAREASAEVARRLRA